MTNKFCHLLNISSHEEMPYKEISIILSRNCHHKDMRNDHKLNHNGTVIGLKLLDATYIDLSIFPTKFTELGWFMRQRFDQKECNLSTNHEKTKRGKYCFV